VHANNRAWLQSFDGHHCWTSIQLSYELGLLAQRSPSGPLSSNEAQANNVRAVQFGPTPSHFCFLFFIILLNFWT
jgi:hypothetical protein